MWQHLPDSIDPVAFAVGGMTVYWYGLLYVAGLSVGLVFLLRRARQRVSVLDVDGVWDMAAGLLVGILVGGRLGYALLYNLDFFVANPWQLVWPTNTVTGVYSGIAGMSFHGSLIGVIAAIWWYARKSHLSFWGVADELALAAPLGIMLGRIGNFLNQELFGRVTTSSIGMHVPGTWPEEALRYPSQLFEAFGEGLLLFVLVNRFPVRFSGGRALIFVIGYGAVRFFLEFFREPDPQIGTVLFGLTIGQLLCVALVAGGVGGWWVLRRYGILETDTGRSQNPLKSEK